SLRVRSVAMPKIEQIDRSATQADSNTIELRADRSKAPARPVPRTEPQERFAQAAAALKRVPRNSLRRWALIMVLPWVLLACGYWYVTGGQVMSTDNAYVEADTVGVSTDVSGIVKDVDVTENEHVTAGQVLYRLDDLPFQLALQRADAQIGIVRNDLNALKANYRNVQEQIKQAQYDVDYRNTIFLRRQALVGGHVVAKEDFDTAQRDLQNAQQRLASLKQQLAEIAANLNGDPDQPIEQHPRYMQAVAERDEAARQLDHSVVKAPFPGIVTEVP